MPLFNWLLSVGGIIATKAAETLTTETLKKWISEGKTDFAQKRLLALYEQVAALEDASLEFVQLFDGFIQQERSRASDDKVLSPFASTIGDPNSFCDNNDSRWYKTWGQVLAARARRVEQRVQAVSTALQEMNPQAEICLPNVTEFLDGYNECVALEIGFVDRAMEYGVVQQFRSTTYGELRADVIKIKASVHALSKAKRVLADFIRDEFSFSELL